MASLLPSISGTIQEIMRIHGFLPSRPSIDDVDAAKALVRDMDNEEQTHLQAISKRKKSIEVPGELFSVLQEMEKNLICFQSKEQKREALKLLDLESIHALFDELVQRASACIPSSSNGSVTSVPASSPTVRAADFRPGFDSSITGSPMLEMGVERNRITRDDSYLKKAKPTMVVDGIGFESNASRGFLLNSTMKNAASPGECCQKLSLIKLASLIEVSAKNGSREINLQNKLMDQVDWIPDSIGKLNDLTALDLSENQIITLPATIGSLSSLTKLDLHSNRIAKLPETIGNLLNLLHLDLRGNKLHSLPTTIGNLVDLVELDLSSNRLSFLSDAIGNLVNLKKLNIETNDIEELPHTICHCISLVELRAEYNRLKCLPEGVGSLQSLEILSVRYNNIKGLPTTMASLSKLKELDVSFNELESVPESLCLATTLVKLNLGNNFADLQSLPRSIGNLEMLEELDISNNQIRVLPDSFSMLSHLCVLHVEENPLEVPARHIIEMGAQAVVNYMGELVAKRDIRSQPLRNKKTWPHFCFFSRPNKRKHGRLDYIKA